MKDYLSLLKGLSKRFTKVSEQATITTAKQCALLITLKMYNQYLETFIDQIDRRLLKEETIPSEEKIYSIFEPETEWINKGKSNPNVELGHRVLITTDQFQFIVDYKVMESETDYEQIESLKDRLADRYPNSSIKSHSFDKGFFSKKNYKTLKNSKVEQVILPKKGKKNKEEKQRESDPNFIKLRHAHSAVESNINMLEHHALDQCPDKGLPKYKRYVGIGVLAYNLHILGNHLLAEEKKKAEKGKKRSHRKVA